MNHLVLQALEQEDRGRRSINKDNNNGSNSSHSSLLQMDCEQEVEQSGAITSVNLSTLVADQQDLMAGAVQDLEESSSNASDSSPISHDMVNLLLENNETR